MQGSRLSSISDSTIVGEPFDESYAIKVCRERSVAGEIDQRIPNPGLARLNTAPDIFHPDGSPNSPRNRTVLQQHVDFFNPDQDGVITVIDTYSGFRRLGFNIFFCLLAVVVIHFGFSLATTFPWPDPFFRIYTDKIHQAKHGSDSGVYDNEGRFIPQKFEEIFSKWDKDDDGYLGFRDMWQMGKDLFVVNDFFGLFANKFEWGTLWLLCANQDGLVAREDIRGCFDGTLFQRIEEQNKMKKHQRTSQRRPADLKVQ